MAVVCRSTCGVDGAMTNTDAQNKTLARLAGADWRVLGFCGDDLWICKQCRIQKVFSVVDAKGALLGKGRLDFIAAFGKAKAIRLVEEVFV